MTLKLKEERLKRLARIHLLKKRMKRKWDARKLQEILRMMRNMSIEDLEMELEEVEAMAIEMMDRDLMEESDVSEMSVLEDGPGGEWVATTLPSGSEISISGDYQPDEDYRQENTRGGSKISLGWRGDREKFGDISVMISRWETQEQEENTPVVEMVKKRRRSANLDRMVLELNLEPNEKVDTKENSKLENSLGGIESLFVPFSYTPNMSKSWVTEVAHGSLLEQTISLRTERAIGGNKRKSEREDYQPRKRRRDNSAD